MSKGQKWTQAELDFLRDNYEKLSHAEMAARLRSRSTNAVKTKCAVLGFVNIKPRWTTEDIEYLKEFYPNTNSKDLAEKLGRSILSVYQTARILGLYKSKEWIARNARENMMRPDHPGKTTQFKKGQTSWNKGKKGLRFAGSEKGYFQKGHTPHNSVPVGTESVIQGYVKVKIAEPNVWERKQRLIWKQNFGEIPENHRIIFKDGNPLNFALENLECLSVEDIARRNSIHNLPDDLKKTIQTLGQLKRKINRRIKNAEK